MHLDHGGTVISDDKAIKDSNYYIVLYLKKKCLNVILVTLYNNFIRLLNNYYI